MAIGIFEVLRCCAGYHWRTAITRHCHVLSTHERLIANRPVDKMGAVGPEPFSRSDRANGRGIWHRICGGYPGRA